MICLIQRVSAAQVQVKNQIIGQIGAGLLVLTAFQPHDNSQTIKKMTHKLLHYRVFADENNKMNLNTQQVNGELLLIPQFTLAADTKSGLRPSFSTSASPQQATLWFDEFVNNVTHSYHSPKTGKFGVDMQVSLTNNGPVTFWLEV